MEILIRHAINKDLFHIQKLMAELNDFQIKNFSNSNKPFHERVRAYPKIKKPDIEKDTILVAELNNTIIGYIWGSIHERKSHKLSKDIALAAKSTATRPYPVATRGCVTRIVPSDHRPPRRAALRPGTPSGRLDANDRGEFGRSEQCGQVINVGGQDDARLRGNSNRGDDRIDP